jgi:hypothetical protein
LAKIKQQLMKHLLLFLFFLVISNYSFCQLKPAKDTITEYQRIDLKLEKFRYQHQTGVWLSIVGACAILAPTLATGKINNEALAVGCILSTAGLFISLNSYKHLRYPSSDTQPVQSKSESKEPTPKAKPKSWWTPR